MATTKVPNNLIDLSGDSGAVPWAAGTTAQRPGSPNAGDFRYNTDDTKFEFYDGSDWKQINTFYICLLYTSPSPRDRQKSRMPSSA